MLVNITRKILNDIEELCSFALLDEYSVVANEALSVTEWMSFDMNMNALNPNEYAYVLLHSSQYSERHIDAGCFSTGEVVAIYRNEADAREHMRTLEDTWAASYDEDGNEPQHVWWVQGGVIV